MANYDISSSESRAQALDLASDEQLERWANDPECNQRLLCAAFLAKRNEARMFNPRTEVSADARHIVKHLWIVLAVLPFVLTILYEILKSVQ